MVRFSSPQDKGKDSAKGDYNNFKLDSDLDLMYEIILQLSAQCLHYFLTVSQALIAILVAYINFLL